MEDIEILSKLATLLIAGVVAAFIAVRLKLPTILGYLAAGVALGILIPEVTHSSFIEGLAQLGAAMLLFTIGIEFSLESIRNVAKVVIPGAIVQAILIIALAWFLMPFIGFSDYESLFIGIMVSMSSTAFVVRMLENKGQVNSLAGKLMVGWLIVQDVLIVLWFLLLATFAPNAEQAPDLLGAILKSLLVIGVTYSVGKYALPPILKQVAKAKSEELLLVSIVGVIALFAVFAGTLEVSFTIGAFLAGLALSESFLNHQIFTEVKPLRNLFMMVFFISIGALVDLQAILDNIGPILLLLLVFLPLKILFITIINLWFKIHVRNSLRVGFGLFQIGEFAFLGAQLGLLNGWISQELYTIIVAAAVISMALTPLLYNNLERVYAFLENWLQGAAPNLYRSLFLSAVEADVTTGKGGHVVLAGYGRVGSYIASALKTSDITHTVIELDANNFGGDPDSENVIYGDATSADILEQAGVPIAKVLVIALPDQDIATEVMDKARDLNPEIKIVARTHGGSTHFNLDTIDDAVEPEFEAAVQIITKLYKLIKKRSKRAIDVVRDLQKNNWS